jgi:2-methylcitrate dehydratase PrpD
MNALEPLDEQAEEVPVTALFARRVLDVEFDRVESAALSMARDCVLDWIGVTAAAARDPLIDIVLDVECAANCEGTATLIGRTQRATPLQAAVINGTAAHAREHGAVHLGMGGEPAAPVLAALFALVQSIPAPICGREFLAAFVAGYETACAMADLLPAHRALGFDSTATLGAFGAVAACVRLLRVTPLQACHAFGVAGTLASGLQSMSGTMARALQAGRAAHNGLYAARLAQRGFESRTDVLECERGFSRGGSVDFDPQRALGRPAGGWHLLGNRFRFHAAHIGLHAPIECAGQLREQFGPALGDIAYIALRVGEACEAACSIEAPRDAHEARFSLRTAVAMALCSAPAHEADALTMQHVNAPQTVTLRKLVRVEAVPGWSVTRCELSIVLKDGAMMTSRADVGLHAGTSSVRDKFDLLAQPVFGAARAVAIASAAETLDVCPDMRVVLALCETP